MNDVIVVGAGPAGSVTARELARSGLDVLLVDKSTFPRGKVCGCCLNGSAVQTLREIGLGSLLGECGAVPLTRVRLSAGGRRAMLGLPGGVALSRESFDMALIDGAVDAGVIFRPGVSAKLGQDTGGGRAVTLSDGSRTDTITARVVVAADGLNGRLTAAEDNPPAVAPMSRIGAGVVVDSDSTRDGYEQGTVHMAIAPGGYVGAVRLEDGRLDLAAAFDPTFVRTEGGLGPAAEAVLRHAGSPPIPGVSQLSWRGTPPLTRSPRRLSGPGWFAVGDAGGYVEPFTGEGMAWAVASGVAVAPIVAAAVADAGWDTRREADWDTAHARIVRRRQGACRAIARVLRSPRLCRLAITTLSLAPWLAGPVVASFNRATPSHRGTRPLTREAHREPV